MDPTYENLVQSASSGDKTAQKALHDYCEEHGLTEPINLSTARDLVKKYKEPIERARKEKEFNVIIEIHKRIRDAAEKGEEVLYVTLKELDITMNSESVILTTFRNLGFGASTDSISHRRKFIISWR